MPDPFFLLLVLLPPLARFLRLRGVVAPLRTVCRRLNGLWATKHL